MVEYLCDGQEAPVHEVFPGRGQQHCPQPLRGLHGHLRQQRGQHVGVALHVTHHVALAGTPIATHLQRRVVAEQQRH